MLLAKAATTAAGEPELAAATRSRCGRCGIALSALLAGHQGAFCPACVAVCVARTLSDWESTQRSSRRLIAWLRRRKPLWRNLKRRKQTPTASPRSRSPS